MTIRSVEIYFTLWGRAVFRRYLGAGALALAASCIVSAPARAFDSLSEKLDLRQYFVPAPLRNNPNSFFVFGGGLTEGNMGQSAFPFSVSYADNRIVGLAFDRELFRSQKDTAVGIQIGVADRFGDGNSGEFWAGIHLHATTIRIPDIVYIKLSVTIGLSAVTSAIGIESERAIEHQGNPNLLFYFSPEIALTLPRFPNVDLVFQLHHRSGLYGTLGHMQEGSSADVIGLRYHF
jgi:hypothetical protein